MPFGPPTSGAIVMALVLMAGCSQPAFPSRGLHANDALDWMIFMQGEPEGVLVGLRGTGSPHGTGSPTLATSWTGYWMEPGTTVATQLVLWSDGTTERHTAPAMGDMTLHGSLPYPVSVDSDEALDRLLAANGGSSAVTGVVEFWLTPVAGRAAWVVTLAPTPEAPAPVAYVDAHSGEVLSAFPGGPMSMDFTKARLLADDASAAWSPDAYAVEAYGFEGPSGIGPSEVFFFHQGPSILLIPPDLQDSDGKTGFWTLAYHSPGKARTVAVSVLAGGTVLVGADAAALGSLEFYTEARFPDPMVDPTSLMPAISYPPTGIFSTYIARSRGGPAEWGVSLPGNVPQWFYFDAATGNSTGCSQPAQRCP